MFSGSGIIESGIKIEHELAFCARMVNKVFVTIVVNEILKNIQKKKLEYYNDYTKWGVG